MALTVPSSPTSANIFPRPVSLILAVLASQYITVRGLKINIKQQHTKHSHSDVTPPLLSLAMSLWIILTLTSLAITLFGVLLSGTVYLLKRYSSTRGDYYTQVTQDLKLR